MLFCGITSCSPKIYEYLETYNTNIERDTLYFRDSIFCDRFQSIKEKNDTVYITDIKTVYKDKIVYRTQRDTVTVTKTEYQKEIVEVEKQLNWWQKFRLKGFWILLALVLIPIIFKVIKFFK